MIPTPIPTGIPTPFGPIGFIQLPGFAIRGAVVLPGSKGDELASEERGI